MTCRTAKLSTSRKHSNGFYNTISAFISAAINTVMVGSKRSTVTACLPTEVDIDISPGSTPVRKKLKPLSSPSLNVQTNLRHLQPKALQIAEQLAKLYPEPPIPLHHSSHFQLLCAVILSAQTTDKKVNEVTPTLFSIAPDPNSMANLSVEDIIEHIRKVGLAPTKAKNLKACAQQLVEMHDGQIPRSFEELEALPGVGHKTASVVMAQCFGEDAFPIDTHIHRLAQRWGLTSGKSVEQTEADLKLLFPKKMWRDLHLQIIYLGRDKCPAKNHHPEACPICCWAAVPPYDKPGNSPGSVLRKKKASI